MPAPDGYLRAAANERFPALDPEDGVLEVAGPTGGEPILRFGGTVTTVAVPEGGAAVADGGLGISVALMEELVALQDEGLAVTIAALTRTVSSHAEDTVVTIAFLTGADRVLVVGTDPLVLRLSDRAAILLKVADD